jgi:predicted ABC-type sugar transport system permease subunit
MISALQTALGGLHSASRSLESAAGNIVGAGLQFHNDAAAAAAGGAGPVTGSPTTPPLSLGSLTGAGDIDLVDGLVSMKEAEIQFTASARMIGAIARTEGELLDILA